jgi:hypothetical protein
MDKRVEPDNQVPLPAVSLNSRMKEYRRESRGTPSEVTAVLENRERTTIREQNKPLKRLGDCDAIAAVANDLAMRLNNALLDGCFPSR